MKHKLLILAASMMFSLGASAQSLTATWEKPASPKFTTWAPETTCYLWNVGAQAFWINHQGGNDAPYYGTHAAVNRDKGAEVIFTRTNPGSTAETDLEASTAWEENTYLLVSYVTKFSEKRCAFYTNANDVWTDNNTQANRYWTVVPNGQYIKITGSTLNEVEKGETPAYTSAGYYLGWEQDDDQMCVRFDDPSGEMGPEAVYSTDWAVVSPEEYQEFFRYLVAEELKTAIEDLMTEAGSKVDLNAEAAVYNNTSSTYAELQAAIESVGDKRVEYLASTASEEHPADFTGRLVNADFGAGNISGWTCTFVGQSEQATNIGYQGANYANGEYTISGFIEAWHKSHELGDGKLSQLISKLPAGKYKFTVDIIACDQHKKRTPVTGVELFAIGGEAEAVQECSSADGKPEHYEITFISTGGDIELGLRTVSTTANWIAADNFTLTYYGPVKDDPDMVLLKTEIAKAEAAYPDLDLIYANKDIKDAYSTSLANANDAVTAREGEFKELLKALQKAEADLATSVKDYDNYDKNLKDSFDGKLDILEGFSEDIAGLVSDQLSEWADAYSDESLTSEEINSMSSVITELIKQKTAEELQNNGEDHIGDDISFLLDNNNFDNDFSGWNVTGTSPVFGGKDDQANYGGSMAGTLGELETPTGDTDASGYSGFYLNSGCAERYQAVFNMSQTIKDLPLGAYIFTCQAFSRDDDGNGTIEAVLYANANGKEQKVALPNQLDYASTDMVFRGKDDAWYQDQTTGDGKYVPNGMGAANYHFQHDEDKDGVNDYTVSLNLILSETSDVTVGVKTESAGEWVIFDNFRLIYNGEDPSAFIQMIKDLSTEADDLVTNTENNGGVVGSDAKESINTAKDQGASAGTTSEYIAAIEALRDAIDNAKKSVAAYEKANEALANVDLAINENPEATEEALGEASAVIEKHGDNIANGNYTVEQVEAAIEEMNKAIAALKYPADYTNASDANPVDFTAQITNPSFEGDGTGSLDGWEYYKGGDTKAADNSNSTYTITNADGSYVFNTWNGSAPEGGFYVSQKLSYLPAGTYELKNLMASDANNVITMSVNDIAVDYTMENPKETGEYSSIIFEVKEGDVIEIKASSSTWFKVDNFTLTYYGTESEKEPTTAIDAINSSSDLKNAVIYNVAGQRMNVLQKGINIVNGKKVYVK